jgi:hypothetical protein
MSLTNARPCSIAYNRVRDPLPLASHFYGCDIMPFHVAPPTSNQVRVLVRPNTGLPGLAAAPSMVLKHFL